MMIRAQSALRLCNQLSKNIVRWFKCKNGTSNQMPLKSFLQDICAKHEKSFPSKADPVEHILTPRFYGELPCQGRSDLLKFFWSNVCNEEVVGKTFGINSSNIHVSGANPYNPILMVLSGPGFGKTYFLREIGRGNSKPTSTSNGTCTGIEGVANNIQNLKFVPISFSSETPLTRAEMYIEKDIKDIEFVLFFPRLVHSLFACDIDFEQFHGQFLKCYGHNFNHLFVELQALTKAHFPGKTFAVLVDEIQKTDRILDNYKDREVSGLVRRLILSYCNLGTSDNLFNFSVFTSLNSKFIHKTIIEEESAKVIPLGSLSMLSSDDVVPLLLFAIKYSKIQFLYEDCGEVCEKDQLYVIQKTAEIIQAITGGHPRSIDYILCEIHSRLNVDPKEKYTLADIFRLAIVYDKGTMKTNRECIRLAVIGKSVNYDDVIPSLKCTYEYAVERGHFIGSFTPGVKYTPFICELSILGYINEKFGNYSKKPEYRISDETELLSDLMNCRTHSEPVVVEKVVYSREILLSKYRYDDAELDSKQIDSKRRGRSTTVVNEIFPNGIQSSKYNKSHALNAFELKIDRNNVLEKFDTKKWANTEYEAFYRSDSTLFVPERPENKPFDFAIKYPIVKAANNKPVESLYSLAPLHQQEQQILEVFYQIRYPSSNLDASCKPKDKLNVHSINQFHKHCKKVAKNPNLFVLVIFGGNESFDEDIDTSCLPENTVVYDEKRMACEIGPTIYSLIKTRETPNILLQSLRVN